MGTNSDFAAPAMNFIVLTAVLSCLNSSFYVASRVLFVLASKGGMAGVTSADGVKRVIDGRPEALRRNCEDSLQRLQVETIDLYYLHRWDKTVPIEESVGALADLVRAHDMGPVLPPRDVEGIATLLERSLTAFRAGSYRVDHAARDVERYHRDAQAGQLAAFARSLC